MAQRREGASQDRPGNQRRQKPPWNGQRVRRLRYFLGLSQQSLAQELGIRQQTVSEWETERYSPRGASARLLSILAERAGFSYKTEEERE